MSALGGIGKFFAREQVQQWGILSLLVVLLLGIACFILLVMVPDVQRRTEYESLLIAGEQNLTNAQLEKAAAPGKLQTRLAETQARLNQVAQVFLTEAEATAAVNHLYTYAEEASVEIVNLRAAPTIVAFAHTQRDYQFQAMGSAPSLLDFLGRIDEVSLPGFVVSNVSIVPSAETPTSEANHLLTMNVTVLTSPYSVRMVAGETQELDNFASGGDLPLAEIQRQVEIAWTARDWDQVIDLLEPVVQSAPDNEAARTALYRAHVNNGYRYLSARDEAAAKAAFEAALLIRPDGKEATAELQQMSNDTNLSHSVEDKLRQDVENAKLAGNWQEVIRLLRIIAAVDPEYGPVGDALTQAYINYGNQLALAGDTARAEEQYQLAQYPSPNQPATDAVLAATQPLTGSVPAAVPVPPIPTPVPLPTETPTPIPTPSPIPTAIPPPTATQTPIPIPTATPSATQPPSPTATTPATATSVPTASATPTLIATAITGQTATITPTSTSVPIATQALPATPTYIVQEGDTLYAIAQRYGTTVEAIMQANGLNSTRINIGQNLRIPVPISLAPLENTNHT